MQSDLDAIARGYDSASDFDSHSLRYGAQRIVQHARGRALLECSCASGVMSEVFAANFDPLMIIEGSALYCDVVRRKLHGARNVEVHHARLEEFAAPRRFDEVVAASILEHLDDPVGFLQRAVRDWLTPGGRVHIIVPNAGSLNRRVGVAMRMIPDLHHLHERDHALGHQRVYDLSQLLGHLTQASLQPVAVEGILIKPLSNAQMQSWEAGVIQALFDVAVDLPEISNQLYVVAEVK